jgi:hypothetical protein
MYNLMIKIDGYILRLLSSSSKLGFLLWFYKKYVPQRTNLFAVFCVLANSFSRICVTMTTWKLTKKIVAVKNRIAASSRILCVYLINMLEATMAASSNYFSVFLQSSISQKSLFQSFTTLTVLGR